MIAGEGLGIISPELLVAFFSSSAPMCAKVHDVELLIRQEIGIV